MLVILFIYSIEKAREVYIMLLLKMLMLITLMIAVLFLIGSENYYSIHIVFFFTDWIQLGEDYQPFG